MFVVCLFCVAHLDLRDGVVHGLEPQQRPLGVPPRLPVVGAAGAHRPALAGEPVAAEPLDGDVDVFAQPGVRGLAQDLDAPGNLGLVQEHDL